MKATTVLLAGHSRQYRVGSSCLSRCVQLVEEEIELREVKWQMA